MDILNYFKNYMEASQDFKNLIYDGNSVLDIVNFYNIDFETVISLLIRYDENPDPFILSKIKEFYNEFTINDERVLVISDTHIGSIYEEQYLIAKAYEYAYKNNIKNVIHAGDLVEGLSNTTNVKDDINKQFLKVNNFYNHTKDINTYLLLGNHDFNLEFYNNVDLLDKFKNLKNLIHIGTETSYMNFNDNFIKIYHETKSQFKKVPDFYANITLEGHHHRYDFSNKKIILPPLFKAYNSGFIELIDNGNYVYSRHFGFNDNYSLKEKNYEKILKKNI